MSPESNEAQPTGAETSVLPREEMISIKAGRRYVGETGRVTNPVQFCNLGGYFRSWSRTSDPEAEGPDPLFGRWSADGKPVSQDSDSLTHENFGALVSEVTK